MSDAERGLGRSDWVAFAALLVSGVSALIAGLSWWSQDEAAELSVLPAVTMYHRVEVPLVPQKPQHDITTFMWKIENTGGGPAFIQRAVLKTPNNETLPMDSGPAWAALQSHIETVLGSLEIVAYDNDPIGCPYAVRSGAEWPLYSVSVKGNASSATDQIAEIEVAACYCSLHGECFYVDSNSETADQPIQCPEAEDAGDLLRGDSCAV